MVYELATSALQQLPLLVQEPPPYFALPLFGPTVPSRVPEPGQDLQGSPDAGAEPEQTMGDQPAGPRRDRRRMEKRAYDATFESRLLKEEMER